MVALASPSVYAAPGVDEIRELHAQADAQIQRARAQADLRRASEHFAEAAALYARAAALIPETEADREARDELLGKVVTSALEAHRLASDNEKPLKAALAVVRAHIDELERAYGDRAGALPEYGQAQRRLILVRARLGPEPTAAPAEPTEAVPSPPTPATEPPAQPDAQHERRPDAPAPATGNDTPAPDRAALDWTRVGFGASLTLAGVSLAATLGTSLSVTREPFTGHLYEDIIDAADANNVAHEAGDDMCALGRSTAVTEVVDACDRRDRVARAAAAMAAMTVVFTASSVVFGVLMARRKHPRNAARVSPGVMSLPGGLFLGASGRF